MLSKITRLVSVCLIVSLTCVSSNATTVIETLTPEDRNMLEQYLQFDFDKPIENVDIKNYISDKISNSGDRLEEFNGIQLIYHLKKDHQVYFEDVLYDFIVKNMNHDSFSRSFIKKDGEGENTLIAMYALGLIRSDFVIDFLLSLIEPVEKWPDEFRNIMIKNSDREYLEAEFRRDAMSALLQPKDKVGEGLLYVIEDKIESLDESSTKELFRTYIDIWKRIYEESKVKNFDEYEN